MDRAIYLTTTLMSVLILAMAPAAAAEDGHQHGGHADPDAPAATARIGDVYPLAVDPLGEDLITAENPVVTVHDGRELRFATVHNLELFRADPAKYLAEVDRKIIAQQKPAYPMDTCVVSGQTLGQMGEPIDFVYGNRLVRFCCGGCEGTLRKDPGGLFETIDAAVIAAQQNDYPMATCVVSGDNLKEMGEPIAYVIGTRLVLLCCPGCVDMFEAHPARYLAMLDAAERGDGNDGGHGENHGQHRPDHNAADSHRDGGQ